MASSYFATPLIRPVFTQQYAPVSKQHALLQSCQLKFKPLRFPAHSAHTFSLLVTQLDAGVSEQILLMSADEQSMVVVSYADIRTCLDSAYAELRAKAAPANKGGAASPVMRQALKGRSGVQ